MKTLLTMSKSVKSLLHMLLPAACAAVLLAGCGEASPVVGSKPLVCVSIEPQRWLLEQIAGSRVEVRTLMAGGGNPESYEPSFSHLVNVQRSRAFFRLGNLGFESAIMEKVKANNPDLPIFCVSDSIALLEHDHGHDHHGHSHAGHSGADPHTWTSAKNAKVMAANMLRGMVAIDSAHAREYTNNFIALSARLDSLDSLIGEILAPHRGHAFIVWHPSLSYFARDYGLHQIALGAEGREPSVADVKRLISDAESSEAELFLIQRDFDRNQADAIVAGLGNGIAVEEFSPLNYDFDAELIRIARCIAAH